MGSVEYTGVDADATGARLEREGGRRRAGEAEAPLDAQVRHSPRRARGDPRDAGRARWSRPDGGARRAAREGGEAVRRWRRCRGWRRRRKGIEGWVARLTVSSGAPRAFGPGAPAASAASARRPAPTQPGRRRHRRRAVPRAAAARAAGATFRNPSAPKRDRWISGSGVNPRARARRSNGGSARVVSRRSRYRGGEVRDLQMRLRKCEWVSTGTASSTG